MIREKIIPALDVSTKEDLDRLIYELKDEAVMAKVGMELYYSYGNEILQKLKAENFEIFLDLKLHDIPNTVERAAKSLVRNGVDILNVHAAGGSDMMKAALNAVKSENESAMLIGVTQLTSTSKEMMNNELLITGSVEDTVLHYAELVKNAGLDGIVCSPHEVKLIKEKLGSDFKCITPGIRLKGSDSHDQKRIMTPLEAIQTGSDYLVIGRAITEAPSPKKAFKDIIDDIHKGLNL